jgi:TolB-like protein/DNA-binding winged helix-turn-helix (wHTH) protein/Flp pilus assembly protein TadD
MLNSSRPDEERSSDSFYCFDEFTLDSANFGLYRNGQPKPLPPRAFDLLLYLIKNRERVVEKQELFEQIWHESFVTDNALTRAIKDIRKELDDEAASPRFIQTVVKRGYRFIGELRDPPSKELPSGSAGVETDGEARHQHTTPEPGPTHLDNNNKIVVGLVILAILVSAGFYYFGRNDRQIRSIAVLPLENSTGDPEADYMSDGITESLINSLSRLPQLRVIPRSTAFRYKRREVDARQLGRELGVYAVVTGRVTRQGDNLFVQTELTNTTDGAQFWGERFSRKLSDIFLLQEEIARVVSEKLRLKLSNEEEKRLTKRYTENAPAYEAYLKGRYHLAKLTPEQVAKSVSYFEEAIANDHSFALAHVGLADAYSALALSLDLPPTEFYPKAKASAKKALEMDETLAEAHNALGFAIQFYDWDLNAAEDQYKRALELNPNSPEAHFASASLFTVWGRFDEALAEIQRAREIDPLDLRTNALEGRFLIVAGRADDAIDRLKKTIELEPNYFLAHLFAANAYTEKGMYEEALAEAAKARELSNDNAEAIATVGYILGKSGRGNEAISVLAELSKRAATRYVPPYSFALVYNGLGQLDETFKWLELGVEKRDPKMLFLRNGPQWNNLRGDARFNSLLERMNFPNKNS